MDSFSLLILTIQTNKKEATSVHLLKQRKNQWITKEYLELMKDKDKHYKMKAKKTI